MISIKRAEKPVSWLMVGLFTLVLAIGAIVDESTSVSVQASQAGISQATDQSIQVNEAGLWNWLKRGWNCLRCIERGIAGDNSDAHKGRCKYCSTGSAS
jgi:hypothetical protein